jgi:hypothetical protein
MKVELFIILSLDQGLTLGTFQLSWATKVLIQLSNLIHNNNFFSFDENGDPVMLLSIPKEKFLKICENFPDSKRILVEKAKKRRKQFKLNKIKSLVKLMKVLVNNFECGFKKIA